MGQALETVDTAMRESEPVAAGTEVRHDPGKLARATLARVP